MREIQDGRTMTKVYCVLKEAAHICDKLHLTVLSNSQSGKLHSKISEFGHQNSETVHVHPFQGVGVFTQSLLGSLNLMGEQLISLWQSAALLAHS